MLILKINLKKNKIKKQPNTANLNKLVKTLRFSNIKHVVALFNLNTSGIFFVSFCLILSACLLLRLPPVILNRMLTSFI